MMLQDTGERLIADAVHADDRLALTLRDYTTTRYEHAARHCVGKRVLDLACGSGYGSRILSDRGAREVVGVDCFPDAVAYARERYGVPGLQFSVGDAETFDADGFDVIVSFETVEHLKRPLLFLQRLHSMLVPGGLLMVSATTVPTSDFYMYHLHDFTVGELRALVERAGYQVRAELAQGRRIELGEMRTAAKYRPTPLPFKRMAARPTHYLRRIARVLVERGYDYSNLLLECSRSRE